MIRDMSCWFVEFVVTLMVLETLSLGKTTVVVILRSVCSWFSTPRILVMVFSIISTRCILGVSVLCNFTVSGFTTCVVVIIG